jgi:hypothetical protein
MCTQGRCNAGAIRRIQEDMVRRFPSEPAPVFGREYETLPQVIMAYAYLSVNVAFTHPYYTHPRPLEFADSSGARTGVTAFSGQSSIPAKDHLALRGQVEILHYEYGDTPETAEFVVDLCVQTQPYQVILARIRPGKTLGETVRIMQEKAARFTEDPDYEVLRRLRPIDTLLVPDVLYKLTHHFDELLGKPLGNPQWRGHFIFDALQKIDFSLSRTGVVLKSEARLGAAAGIRRNLTEPRRLHFDRPFLICVKKREADATPFFLMWVDNAELMQLAGRDP